VTLQRATIAPLSLSPADWQGGYKAESDGRGLGLPLGI
jgi:hypothetical protein